MAGAIERIQAFTRRHLTWRRIVLIAAAIVEEVGWGYGLAFLGRFWEVVVAFGNRPLREGGAVLVLFLALALLWVAIDPIGQWRRRVSVSRKLIEAGLRDEMEVERARELWTNDVEQAIQTLASLTYRLATHTREKGHLGSPLFARQSEALTEAQRIVAASLDPRETSLTHLQERLGTLVTRYWECARALEECFRADPSLHAALNDESQTRSIDHWEKLHPAFALMINSLNRRSTYGAPARIWHLPEILADFRSPFSLPRPPLQSGPDTSVPPSPESAS